MLFREDLSKADIKKLKAVATDLLRKVKALISTLDHWTDKQETREAVSNLIRDTLWTELPESFDDEAVSQCRQTVYEFVFMRYKQVAA